MTFSKLAERHLPLVDAFTCVESDIELSRFKSNERRRIKKHSREMDDFLYNEAYSEQCSGMSTTFVLIDDDSNKIVAYLSLCNDAIRLELKERESTGVTYSSAPALKIARLAVDVSKTHQGLGRYLIEFAAYQAQMIREHSGIFFLTLDCYAHRLSFYESIGFVQNLIQPVTLAYDSPISLRMGLDEYLEKLENNGL